MFGKKAAIKQYRKHLQNALLQRYGGGAPYSVAQVDRTIEDLKLNRRYAHYAYVMYCDNQLLQGKEFSEKQINDMQDTITTVASGGILTAIGLSLVSGDGDGGGFDAGGGE